MARFTGKIFVGEDLASEAEMMCMLGSKDDAK
jgi:hypothetical protein